MHCLFDDLIRFEAHCMDCIATRHAPAVEDPCRRTLYELTELRSKDSDAGDPGGQPAFIEANLAVAPRVRIQMSRASASRSWRHQDCTSPEIQVSPANR